MKRRQLRRLLLVICLLTLPAAALSPFHAVSVHADDNLTLNPTSGPPGVAIAITPNQGAQTYPSGYYFQPYYSSGCSGNSAGGAALPVNSDGTIPTLSLTIPITETAPCASVVVLVGVFTSNQPDAQLIYAYGPYPFTITGSSGATAIPTDTLSPGTPQPTTTGSPIITPQVPSITLSPVAAAVGQTVTVNGAGFAPSSQVTVSGLGAAPTIVNTDPTGAFVTSLAVTGTPGSSVQVAAYDAQGHTAQTTFSITNGQSPTLTLSSTILVPGQQVQVSGTNYTVGDQVAVSLALPGAVSTPLPGTTQSAQVSPSGTLALTYLVPSVAPGAYMLIAVGQPSNTSATPLPVTVQGGVIQSATPQGVLPTATSGAVGGLQPFITSTPVSGVTTPSGSGTPALVGFPTSTPYIPPSPTAAPPSPTAVPHPPTATLPRPTARPTATAVRQPSLSRTTYFAEGNTGKVSSNGFLFQEQLYLFNTTHAAADVAITYYVVTSTSGATRQLSRLVHLKADSAAVRSVNADVGSNHQVSIVVRHSAGVSARVLIARRDGKGHTLDSAATTGSTKAANKWLFAEGYAGPEFQEDLSVFNPTGAPVKVSLSFLTSTGMTAGAQSYTVPRSGRLTINAGKAYLRIAGARASKSIGVLINGNGNVVVDRTLYWGQGTGWGKYGFEITPGATAGAANLLFPVLSPTGSGESYITILNANPQRASIQIVFRGENGQVVTSYTNTVQPLSRLTVSVRSSVPQGTGLISATLNSTEPIVAEAPLYIGGSPSSGDHPGVDVPGTVATASGAIAGVDSSNAVLYIYNPSTSALSVQGIFGSSSGTFRQGVVAVPPLHVSVVSLPGTSGPLGLLLTAPAPFAAVLLNGITSSITWGNVLQPAS